MKAAIGSVVCALAGAVLVLNGQNTVGVTCLCFAIALSVG